MCVGPSVLNSSPSLSGQCLTQVLTQARQPENPARVLSRFSCVRLSVTPWMVAHQDAVSMGILQARILERVAISSSKIQGIFWTQGSNLGLLTSPAWAGKVLYHSCRLGSPSSVGLGNGWNLKPRRPRLESRACLFLPIFCGRSSHIPQPWFPHLDRR